MTIKSGSSKSVRCYTRALKNAMFLKSMSPRLFDRDHTEDGFGTGIPLPVLTKLHHMQYDAPVLRRYSGLSDLIREHPLPRPGQKGRDALFSGTIYFCQVTFQTSSGDKVVPTADMNQIIQYAQQAIVQIQNYANQYGPNNVVISASPLTKSVSVPSGTFTDSDLQGWVNELVGDAGLSSNSCTFVVCPNGIGANEVGDNAGYHGKANIPYIVAGVYETGLTLADTDDRYAMVVSHEIAEMIVDPGVGGGDPEVCDPCDLNCHNLTRIYFDANGNFVGSNQATPPGGLNYSYYICAIVKPGGAADCPASSSNCSYEPVSQLSFSGVWREGTDAYGLWVNADQASFLAKFNEWANQGLRLTDFDVTMVNGGQLWSGVWESGTDPYGLWINSDQAGFLAKWNEWASQGLRLVSIKNYNGLWAGAWRGGNDGYGLWINADEASFLAKCSEWAGQNLRLVDFEVTTTATGDRLWTGVWREGTDGYGLWINADKSSFLAKWNEWTGQNLRLVGLQTYDGLWAGVWREGTDAYGLWLHDGKSGFLGKWNEWAGQNLRLVDLTTMPAGGAGRVLAPAVAAQGVHMAARAAEGGRLVLRGGVQSGGAAGAGGRGELLAQGGFRPGRPRDPAFAGEAGRLGPRGGAHGGRFAGVSSPGESGGAGPGGGAYRSGAAANSGEVGPSGPPGGGHGRRFPGAPSSGDGGGSGPKGGAYLDRSDTAANSGKGGRSGSDLTDLVAGG